MSRYTWILDPGHGGLGPDGEYLTPGKRSPDVPPGIYEGDFNRRVCNWVEILCNKEKIVATTTNPGPVNAGLKERAEYINGLQKARGNCVLFSIHANAATKKDWSPPNGTTVFYHPSNKSSRALAEWSLDCFNQYTALDTRGIKKGRLAILSKTKATPGVLIECGFMTNLGDANYLASEGGQFRIATAIFETIKLFEDERVQCLM